MEGLMLNENDFTCLAKNGHTLKVLNLEAICGRPYTNYGNCMENLIKQCVNLTELNFSNALRDEYVTILVNNINPNIMKLDISGNQVNDDHIYTLVERCKKITELNLRCTSITVHR